MENRGASGEEMNILITGAGGFIGQALTAAFMRDHPKASITLTDITTPNVPTIQDSGDAASWRNVKPIASDLTDKTTVDKLFTADITHVYLLHGIMSGAAEADFGLGLKVNVDSMRLIADAISKIQKSRPIKVVFPSSLAVFGPSQSGEVVTESTMPRPQSSYGMEKAMVELLLNDMTRRRLLDARIVRLPTIIVRPGKPTGAASSFCSGIIREPLNGAKSVIPVGEDMKLWVCSTRTVIRNLVTAGLTPEEKFKSRSRIVNLPAITVTVEQMVSALREVGGDSAYKLLDKGYDDKVANIVGSWPSEFDCSHARALGFHGDVPLTQIINDYIADYMS